MHGREYGISPLAWLDADGAPNWRRLMALCATNFVNISLVPTPGQDSSLKRPALPEMPHFGSDPLDFFWTH